MAVHESFLQIFSQMFWFQTHFTACRLPVDRPSKVLTLLYIACWLPLEGIINRSWLESASVRNRQPWHWKIIISEIILELPGAVIFYDCSLRKSNRKLPKYSSFPNKMRWISLYNLEWYSSHFHHIYYLEIIVSKHLEGILHRTTWNLLLNFVFISPT